MKRHPFNGDGDVLAASPTKVALGISLIGFCRAVDSLLLLTRPRLLWCSVRLVVRGLIRSPYSETGFDRVHLARRANLSKRELVYGETPVFTALRFFRKAGVTRSSSVLDLGAGRGRVLIAARALGAQAKGIELLPEHIQEAAAPLTRIGASLEQGRSQDFRQDNASHVFIAWTCMGEQNRLDLLESLNRLREGTIVIVVTWPIHDPAFCLLSEDRYLFSWGICDLYVYQRVAVEKGEGRSSEENL